MMMTSTFDSFDASPLGGFVESPLGARNAPTLRSVYVATIRGSSVGKLSGDDLGEVVVPFRVLRGAGFLSHVGGDSQVVWIVEGTSGRTGDVFADRQFRLIALDSNTLQTLRSTAAVLTPFSRPQGTVYVQIDKLKGTSATLWALGTGFRNPNGTSGLTRHLLALDPETFGVTKVSPDLRPQFGAIFGPATGGNRRLWVLSQSDNVLHELSASAFIERGELEVLRTINLNDNSVFAGRFFVDMGGGDGPLWFLAARRNSNIVDAFEFDPDAESRENEILQQHSRIADLSRTANVITTIGGD